MNPYTAPCSTSAGTARRQEPFRSASSCACGAAPGCHGLPALRSAAAACPHALLRGDAPDLVPIELGEPEVAIGPGRDALRFATARGDEELPRDDACGGDAPDLVPLGLGEPEVAIGPGRDAQRLAIGRGNVELGDLALGGDAPDVVPIELREPEVAIGPAVMPKGSVTDVGMRDSVTAPAGV